MAWSLLSVATWKGWFVQRLLEAVPGMVVGAEVLVGVGRSWLLVSKPVTVTCLVREHVHYSRSGLLVFVAGSDCQAFAGPVYFLIAAKKVLWSQSYGVCGRVVHVESSAAVEGIQDCWKAKRPQLAPLGLIQSRHQGHPC